MNISNQLIQVAMRDQNSIWDSVKAIGIHTVGKLDQEAQAVCEIEGEPIVCEACRCETRKFPQVYWAWIFDNSTQSGEMGPFRLCQSCGVLSEKEDDPCMSFLGKVYADCSADYRSGYIYFIG